MVYTPAIAVGVLTSALVAGAAAAQTVRRNFFVPGPDQSRLSSVR